MSEPEGITEEGAAAEAVATSMSLAMEELRSRHRLTRGPGEWHSMIRSGSA
jgi:hypothetical protein